MDNIVQLTEQLRQKFRTPRKCQHDGGFTVDPSNGDVECNKCKEAVSAAHALITLSGRWRDLEQRLIQIREERKSLESYEPHLKAVRKLESTWRTRKYLPACPHCRKGIEADDLTKGTVWRGRKP